jgi:hypothetical protein
MINVTTADGEAMPRHKVEAAIEFLINYLDSIDPDPDLEPYLAGAICDDREFDPAEFGIADVDGLQEQVGGLCGVAL